MLRLLTALMFAAALVFGFGYVSSPTYAQDTDQIEEATTEAECEAAGGDWNVDENECGEPG